GDRILGRVVARDVVRPGSDEILILAGTMIDEAWVERIEAMGIDEVCVRSPISCDARNGICSMCYGRDLARGHRVNVGEAVGVIAAQSIGEPGTQLTMRTFEYGCAASRFPLVDSVQVKQAGPVRLTNVKVVSNPAGNRVAVSRSGELAIADASGRERERYKIPYGALITVTDGEAVKGGQIAAKWDPHTHPIVSEVAGKVTLPRIADCLSIHR